MRCILHIRRSNSNNNNHTQMTEIQVHTCSIRSPFSSLHLRSSSLPPHSPSTPPTIVIYNPFHPINLYVTHPLPPHPLSTPCPPLLHTLLLPTSSLHFCSRYVPFPHLAFAPGTRGSCANAPPARLFHLPFNVTALEAPTDITHWFPGHLMAHAKRVYTSCLRAVRSESNWLWSELAS